MAEAAQKAVKKVVFEVQFESPGFGKKNLVGAELSEGFLSGYIAQCKGEGTFPDGVVGVKEVYITNDENTQKCGGKVRVFSCVTLLIEAEDEDEAQDFDPPEDLLTKLADECALEVSQENSLELDEHAWEVADAEEYEGDIEAAV